MQNRATRPFYRAFIDAHDLDEGWDGYQGDGRIIRSHLYHLSSNWLCVSLLHRIAPRIQKTYLPLKTPSHGSSGDIILTSKLSGRTMNSIEPKQSSGLKVKASPLNRLLQIRMNKTAVQNAQEGLL